MNEEPKNIWKKSFTGRIALVIWLAVAAFTIMLGSFICALANYSGSMSDYLLVAGIIAGICLAACLLLIYIVWPSLRWLFWKHWRWTLFGCACFATLIALFYAEEDWRGWHAWQKFKHQWEAKGERFDMASVIPPTVPDDENFALTPIVASCYSYILDKNGHRIQPQLTNVVNRMKMSIYRDSDSKNWPTNGNWQKGKPTDLREWQQYYGNPPKLNSSPAQTNEFPVALQPQSPAADVLLALSKYDSAIEELRQASKLPYSRFPLNYESQPPAAILLPHLAALKHCSQILQLRAIAELQNGQSDEALADVKLMLRLTDSVRTEPILISHLVRIAILQMTLQPVWEGLAEHKWSDAQLTELDSELAKFDFLADYEFSMRGDRAWDIGNIEFLRNPHKRPLQHIREISNLIGDDFQTNKFQMFALAFGPSGWFYQNELRLGRFYAKWYLSGVNEHDRIVFPATVRDADAAVAPEFKHRNPENSLEAILIPGLGIAVKRFAYGQESADLARVAIALERYRIVHGEFFPNRSTRSRRSLSPNCRMTSSTASR